MVQARLCMCCAAAAGGRPCDVCPCCGMVACCELVLLCGVLLAGVLCSMLACMCAVAGGGRRWRLPPWWEGGRSCWRCSLMSAAMSLSAGKVVLYVV
jgi:hypothetical protein